MTLMNVTRKGRKEHLWWCFFPINSATEENNKLKARYEQAKEEVENLVSKMKRLNAITRYCFSAHDFLLLFYRKRKLK